jgi:hypothetical protein
MNLELSKAEPSDDIPDEEELAMLKEAEAGQNNCPCSHKIEDLDPEDGCVACGFYSK